jgi:hypothetical protein
VKAIGIIVFMAVVGLEIWGAVQATTKFIRMDHRIERILEIAEKFNKAD